MVQTNHDQEIFLEHYRRSNIHYEVLEKMSRKYPSIYPLSNYLFTAAFFLAWFIQSLRSILLSSYCIQGTKTEKLRSTFNESTWRYLLSTNCISVCWDCCNRHHNSGCWKSKIKGLTNLMFGEGPLLGYRLPTSLCLHMAEGQKSFLGPLL